MTIQLKRIQYSYFPSFSIGLYQLDYFVLLFCECFSVFLSIYEFHHLSIGQQLQKQNTVVTMCLLLTNGSANDNNVYFWSPFQTSQRRLQKALRIKGVGREMDGWMVYCIINGLTITILWVNDDEHD